MRNRCCLIKRGKTFAILLVINPRKRITKKWRRVEQVLKIRFYWHFSTSIVNLSLGILINLHCPMEIHFISHLKLKVEIEETQRRWVKIFKLQIDKTTNNFYPSRKVNPEFLLMSKSAIKISFILKYIFDCEYWQHLPTISFWRLKRGELEKKLLKPRLFSWLSSGRRLLFKFLSLSLTHFFYVFFGL